VFTARYALSPHIKQIRFVFKGVKVLDRKGSNRIRPTIRNVYSFKLNFHTLFASTLEFAERFLLVTHVDT
jgi:hypothetical protein